MIKLIVTADDYGMSPGVNGAIEEGLLKGVLTTTNVMTNMPVPDGASELKKKYGDISVGLHWTVSVGHPVLPPDDVKTLVNGDGVFHSRDEFVSLCDSGKIDNGELKRELTAQYERFREICGEPDYWNTHQNTHVHMGIFDLFLDTARELGIKKMRCHRKMWVDSDSKKKYGIKNLIAEPAKIMIIEKWRRKAKEYGISMPERVLINTDRTDFWNSSDMYKKYKDGTVAEYVLHPSCKIDSEYLGKMTESRLREYADITNPDIAKSLKENFCLVNYSEVK